MNVLENKILTFESENNSLEQYGHRNNIENTGIPDSVQNLEEKVVDILNWISVDVSPKDIKACHRVGVSQNSSKKTIVHFISRKHANKAIIIRKDLRKNPPSNCNVFINENLTVKSNEIAFLRRKLKGSRHLNKIYTKYGTVHILSPEIHRGKVLKIYHINGLFNLFPYYDVGENCRENDQNHSLQSSY